MTLSSERLAAEWLEADGLGGFASGTVAGWRTRRYHGLLTPAVLPPSGRAVLVDGRVFAARTPEEIRDTFPDHELIRSLAIGSIMNVPIGGPGRRLGVMNVSHDANWFTAEDAENACVIAALLAPALLA